MVLVVCLQHVLADTKPPGGPSAPRGHRSTSNVEFLPSVSRTLPSTRTQYPYFDRNAPASRRSHHARRVANGKPPPYAVQMEPLFQYSQRDPLYQESGADKNKDAISKKFSSGPGVYVNHHGSSNLVSPYQSNFYVTPQPGDGHGNNNNNHYSHYNYHDGNIPPGYIILKEPEPIIEIIVKEANHTLPPPITEPTTPKPREPVHVFFVKYKKDSHGNGVQYEKPVPAITPATPLVSESAETPAPVYTPLATVEPPPTTTLRTVIHPDSETVHINTGGLRITFGEERSHGDHSHYGGQQSEGSFYEDKGHHVEGSEPQPTFAKTPAPPAQQSAQPSAPVQQQSQPSVQIPQHAPPSAPVQHHSQPTKRQQPSARFHAAPFQQPAFGTEQFQPIEQNRFLSPPPVQSQPPSQFNSNFASPPQERQQNFPPFPQRPSFGPPRNQPQFTGKIESAPFQQNFDSPTLQQQNNFPGTGKLEAVPFKQPSTGKIEIGLASNSGRFESNSFNQPPAFPSFRVQEPINGLPPPPPPQTFPRQPSPSFFQQPQFNPRPQPPRPIAPQFNKPAPFPAQTPSFPQQVAPFPQPSLPNTQHTQQPPFSQPQPSAPQQPPKFSQPLPVAPQQAPKFSQPLLSPQQPSFTSPVFSQPGFSSPSFSSPSFSSFTSPPQNSFSFAPTFVPPFSRFPESTTQVSTTAQQFSQPPATTPRPQSFGSEIIQSISPSAEELQRQQQEQFKQEQQYYQEIQKLQQELELRAAQKAQSTTTKKPSGKNPVFTPGTTTTTTTTEAPPRVETPAGNVSAPNLSNFVLPDEVPDDLRQQLLSSGILSNADIQILDYDKVGDIPIESLPQEALQQFIGAGGGGAVGAGSAPVPQYAPAPVKRVSTDVDDSAAEASDRGKH